METMSTWELVLLGILVVLLLFWITPGIKPAFERSRKATAEDWRGLLFPIGLVVLFVVLLIWFVQKS